MESARAELENVEDDKQSELTSYKNDVSVKRISYDAAKKKIETIDNALIELQKSCEDESLLFYNEIVCTKETDAARRQVANLRDDLEEEEDDLDKDEDELARLEDDVDSLQTQIDDAEDEVKDAEDKVEEAKEKLDEAEYKLERLNRLCAS